MILLERLIRSDCLPYNLIGDDDALSHFNQPSSYARFIVRQMNVDDIYAKYLKNKTGLTVLDLGANVGLFSIYASPSASRIVSVEPTPSHINIFKTLTKNIPNIELVQAAVSNRNAPVTFYLSTFNTTINSLFNHSNTGQITVNGKTIKTIMDENNLNTVDFCKIDIEGSEMIAITDETLAEVSHRIKTIFIEVHPTNLPLQVNVNTLVGIFNRNGYSVECIGVDTIVAQKI